MALPSRFSSSRDGRSGKSSRLSILLPVKINFFNEGKSSRPLSVVKVSFSVILSSSRAVKPYIPEQEVSLFLFSFNTLRAVCFFISHSLISFSSSIS